MANDHPSKPWNGRPNGSWLDEIGAAHRQADGRPPVATDPAWAETARPLRRGAGDALGARFPLQHGNRPGPVPPSPPTAGRSGWGLQRGGERTGPSAAELARLMAAARAALAESGLTVPDQTLAEALGQAAKVAQGLSAAPPRPAGAGRGRFQRPD
jgi:hypothetical protein